MPAIAAILGIVPGWVWAIICAGLMVTTCAERNLRQGLKVEFAEAKTAWAQAQAASEKRARELSEQYRKQEAAWAVNVKELNHALKAERVKVDDLVAVGAVTRSMLVSTTFAISTRSGPGTDPAAAARRAEDTAEAYGRLLVQCDRVAEDLGRSAESLAAQVRALIALDESFRDPGADRRQVDPGPAVLGDHVVNPALPNPAP